MRRTRWSAKEPLQEWLQISYMASRVVITGMGVVAPNGVGLHKFNNAIKNGTSGIKRIAKLAKFENVIVGTPDRAVKQINFYEKNGFRKYDLKKDFFIKNYPQPIIDNGVMLRDMVMLKVKISSRPQLVISILS